MAFRKFLYFFAFICPLTTLFANTIKVETFHGKEISSHTQQIINLCNMIYREYPYLYNGDDADYTSYLESLSQLNDAIICLAFDDKKAVGLAIGIPMSETRDVYKPPLIKQGYDLNSVFYLGEFGLKPEYRGQGIEEAMYRKIEDFAKKSGKFNTLCLWEIDNSSNSQQQPLGYIPRDDFWKNLNFVRHQDLNFVLFWQNINDNHETPHLAVYSIKKL
jgi:GNAT superfamily N-acetyltransferase